MRAVRPKLSYSRAELAFLSKNRGMNRRQLHALFVREFSREDVTFFNMRDILHRKGWRRSGARGEVEYSRAEIAFLRRYSAMRLVDLHAIFVERFGRDDVNCHNLRDMLQRRGLRAKRYVRPAPLGSEKVSNGFIMIKTSHTRGRSGHWSFVPKHRWLWEHEHGPIPHGHKLKCLDGDRLNTAPSNWQCVPNGVLGRLAKRGYEAAPAGLKPTIMAVAKLEHSIRRKSGGEEKVVQSRPKRTAEQQALCPRLTICSTSAKL